MSNPLNKLKLDGTDDHDTLLTYTALAVCELHEKVIGNGKKGLIDRVEFLERWVLKVGTVAAAAFVLFQIIIAITT